MPQEVQTNKGSVNAVFFDGHVDRMNDRKARNIELWYPRGSVVRTANEGLTSVPEGNGFVIN